LLLSNGGVVSVTEGHPLFSGDKWVEAGKFERGAILPCLNSDGALVGNSIIDVEKSSTAEDVFHIYCSTDHTYVVEHAISHCFSVARELRGILIDVRAILRAPGSEKTILASGA